MKYLCVEVRPQSQKLKIKKNLGWEASKINEPQFKVWLTSPPIEGKANEELVKAFSKWLGVPRSCIRLAKGDTSKLKMLEFVGCEMTEVVAKLSEIAAD